MERPPETLDGARVLRYAHVTGSVRPTGATRHFAPQGQLGPAAALAIAQYSTDPGFYLFYLDDEGTVATDTYHDSIEDALAQAAFEYEGLTWWDVP
jgi:hypothetical protein